MSVPLSIGWVVLNKRSRTLASPTLYRTRTSAITANYRDGSWEYVASDLSKSAIVAARQAKVLERYDIVEAFVNVDE